jgi:hypothetical protein
VIVEMSYLFGVPPGFPRVERPERAAYRRLIIWGVGGPAPRVDVAIEEGADGRVERFRFENVRLSP